jgi:NitT/TauT family transport system substrate-binding protein
VTSPSVRLRSAALGALLGIAAGFALIALPSAGASTPAQGDDEAVTLRLGYFPNVTHATAIVGVEGGLFEDKLGDGVTLELSTFNAGPAAVEALFADALDATYIGPNPAINAFVQSEGEAIRIISGATSGGAFLVVKPDIEKVKDLKGKAIATPQLGNTQDVALRSSLKKEGLETDIEGGGDVSVQPQDNAVTLQLFQSGDIDGAWVPQPWAERLVSEGGGKVLIDERDLWPDGEYVTTHLVVRTAFLEEHPDVVQKLLEGQVAANDFVNSNRAVAENLVASGIERATGRPIAPELVAATFDTVVFTNDPIASSLRKSAKDAKAVGLLESADLKGIYNLKLLNKVLEKAGQPTVSAK